MNAVEIEEAVSDLAAAPFDAGEFPFRFLQAFGNKETTVNRLRAGSTNSSDVGGVLQTKNIHLAVATPGETGEILRRLRESPRTAKAKAKFILSTDGAQLEAEDLNSGETIACALTELGDHFGFFLPLAGISTVAEVKNNPIDIKATGRLNKLYLEILQENADWGGAARRQDLNRLMARLIFCFFAEDTGIFNGDDLFTATIRQMTEADGSNMHEVLEELFWSMNIDPRRGPRGVRPWADVFPFVNGGLFNDAIDCPRFSRTARAYLLRAGELDWKTINPDIFGSMIQAVADDDERGELGMHYTSVPNIQKVLDPLFLDDLREQLEKAGTNKRMLFNLRQRLSRIRVFDPACGSGNFLVIAYIRMREIEEEIMRRRGEALERSAIRLTQFFGIEIKSFAAEIARLSLLIGEFQSDVRFIGQAEARALVLPLHATGNIVTGNALRLDWEEVCPPVTVAVEEQDLGGPTGRMNLEGGGEAWETYVCGNPPYVGDKYQSAAHKADLALLSHGRGGPKAIDYVVGWFWKASSYISDHGAFAFVSTNSICQGVQPPQMWPRIFNRSQEIFFAHRDFYWSNLASHRANVICVIVGVCAAKRSRRKMLYDGELGAEVGNISPYLLPGPSIIVEKLSKSISDLPTMVAGNIPRDRGHLLLDRDTAAQLISRHPATREFIRKIVGSFESINGVERYCLWISDVQVNIAKSIPEISARLNAIREYRETGSERGKLNADSPHRFERTILATKNQIVVPAVSSQHREFLPIDFTDAGTIILHTAQAVYDAPLHVFSIIASKLHLSWVSMTAGRMKSDIRYSTGVCYNTFPVPKLTETDKANLTRCAEDILLARETHFPATIADLYDPENMPDDLRAAHDRNDETLERIYIGRRFRNDTERLEKLFEMYTKMTAKVAG